MAFTHKSVKKNKITPKQAITIEDPCIEQALPTFRFTVAKHQRG